jgi:hypothetical protein
MLKIPLFVMFPVRAKEKVPPPFPLDWNVPLFVILPLTVTVTGPFPLFPSKNVPPVVTEMLPTLKLFVEVVAPPN